MGSYILTVKDRVEWVYKNYSDAVEADLVLLAIFENYFGTLSHQDISSVKRAGRYWRQQTRFSRSQNKIRHDLRIKNEFIEVFS
tara:strand:- start:71 stop:322 length:252 start_codon:yes stop_codon:yes gene_type:complete